MKRIYGVMVLCFFLSALLPGRTAAGPPHQEINEHAKYREGELLVKFKAGVPDHEKKGLHERLGAEKMKDFPFLLLHLVKLPEGLEVQDALARYAADPAVEYAEPNYVVYAEETIPNDPFFGELYGLHNTGQGGGTPGADISATGAWILTTGNSNIVVAVIDTGIDYNHEDLAANRWMNLSELGGRKNKDDDGNGYVDDIYGIDTYNNDTNPMDDNGHGTHVAGTIGAVGNNGVGVTGVNWNVKVMACKFIGSGGTGPVSGAIACLEYVRTMKAKGINVVATNNSWGGDAYSQALYDAINAQRDILFVAAAGNSNVNNDAGPHYPSGYFLPNVIAVAATNRNDARALFSNYGRRTVHVGAPGEDIVSLRAAGTDMYGDGQHFVPAGDTNAKYYISSGTSMAAPHVAGLAALIKSRDMTRDWIYVRNRILSGSDAVPSLIGSTVTGGRVNAYQSLTCVNRPVFSALKHPVKLVVGRQETLSALSINCESAIGPVTVTLSGGEVITLYDNGLSPDLAAGDGIFTASWTPVRDSEYLTFSSPLGVESFSIPALSVTTPILVEANIRSAYSQRLEAKGGLPPYTWSLISGSLPEGLTLDASTGEISGLPISTGTSAFTAQVTDSQLSTAQRNFSVPVVDDPVIALWIKSYEDGSSNYLRDLALDGSGSVYVSGQVWNESIPEELVMKYDSSGNPLWSKTFSGSNGKGIAVDNAGNVYVTGTLNNTDYHTARLDPAGNVVWTKTYSGVGADYANDIAADGSGNVYVTGYSNNGQNYDYLTIKYDAAGNVRWTKSYDTGTSDYATGLTVDSGGNVYVTGYYWDGSLYNCVTVKYDSNGAVLRAQTYANGKCKAIAVDGNGNVYLTGDLYYGAIHYDLLTVKYDSLWNVVWTRNYDSGRDDYANSIAVDSAGNIYVAGTSALFLSAADSLTLSYDASGNLLWTKTFDTGGDETAMGVAVDPLGDVYVGGYFTPIGLYAKTFVMKYRP